MKPQNRKVMNLRKAIKLLALLLLVVDTVYAGRFFGRRRCCRVVSQVRCRARASVNCCHDVQPGVWQSTNTVTYESQPVQNTTNIVSDNVVVEDTFIPSPEVASVSEGPFLSDATVLYEDTSARFNAEAPIINDAVVMEPTPEPVYAGEYTETSAEYTAPFESPLPVESTDYSTNGLGAPELGPNEVVIEDVTIVSGPDEGSSDDLQPTPAAPTAVSEAPAEPTTVSESPAEPAAVSEVPAQPEPVGESPAEPTADADAVESISDVFPTE